MHASTATLIPLAVAAIALVAPAAAGAQGYPVNPICAVPGPAGGPPGAGIVCEAEATVQVNATVGGYDGPCAQVYPQSELCDETHVGVRVHATGAGAAEACAAVDDRGEPCVLRTVETVAAALP